MAERDTDQVRRRRVFYIPGYDPIPPRRYRELYRREGATQAAISGYGLELTPRPAGIAQGWEVQARIEGAEVVAEVEVLVWSDIVRASMGQSVAGSYLRLIRTGWAYLHSGAFVRLMRLRRGPAIVALYPVAVLLGQLALALAAAVVAAGMVAAVPGLPYAGLVGLVSGALALGAVLHLFRRADHRFFAHYLMHDYAFTAQSGGAWPPALEVRMAEFAARINAALRGNYDEVLVVGHSSGAHLAVSALAEVIRAGLPPGAPALGFLSLGQVVPMVSFLPEARRLRADLRDLAGSDALTWVDVSAPGDPCAFALCDPVAVSGVAPAVRHGPLVISAAFRQTLSPARLRAMRWRFFRRHIQYLCAFDQPGDYDYFRITAGPATLAARFAGRAPSKSRIERAENRHTDCA